MRNITIKAGRTLVWKVDVEGEPAPTIEWSWRDEVPLTNTECISIDNSTPNHTIFTYNNIKRGDRGKYTLKYVFTDLHYRTDKFIFTHKVGPVYIPVLI